MMTLEEIRERLADRNLKAVHKATSISYNTLVEVARGRQTNPTYKTIKAISDYLESK